jgi:hypothetical protein
VIVKTSCFSLLTFSLLVTLLAPRHANDHFNWQTLEAGMLTVHWYQGDAKFGQAAMDAAQTGLESIGRYLPSELKQPIEIFVYANPADLQSELLTGSEKWIAGHADPAQGVVRVVIEPGSEQGIVMEQRIPHELMHVMLYRHVGSGYQTVPAWLREGMATLAEIYPNTDYDRVLAESMQAHRLIPLKDLCVSFPADTGQAFLAYAEARSFTNYLRESYGSNGLLDLAAAYADGATCERGTERALGVSLSSLESQWRTSTLGQNPALSTLQNISPYLVLLCLVLIIPLVGIASTLRRKRKSQ